MTTSRCVGGRERRAARLARPLLMAAALAALLLAGAASGLAQRDDLSLADFDAAGLETVVLASFEAGGATTLWSAADSRWGAAGTLLAGDVELVAGSDVSRIMSPRADGSLLRLNDDGPLALRNFFRASGEGADLTIHLQTDDGLATFPASGVATVGGNFVNFRVPAAERAVLQAIGAGDRFILALSRPAPVQPPTESNTVEDNPTVPDHVDTSSSTDGPVAVSGAADQLATPQATAVSETEGDLPESVETYGGLALGQAARAAFPRTSLWDADWFAAELTGGAAYLIRALGAGAPHCTMPSPYLMNVRDTAGNPIESAGWTHSSRTATDSVVFTPSANDRYYVEVAGGGTLGVGTYLVALTTAGDGAEARIAAIGAQGCFAAAPTRLRSSSETHERVSLRWTAPDHSAISGYRILRGPSAESLSVLVADSGSSASSYADENVRADTRHVYVVAALTAAGPGARSEPLRLTTPETPPKEATLNSPEGELDRRLRAWLRGSTRGALPPARPTTLVSNFQAPSGTQGLPHNQLFTTGDADVGFLLDSVSFHGDIGTDQDDPDGEGVTVALWTDDGDGPGRLLHEIGYFESHRFRNAQQHHSRTNLGLFLLPNTKYWLRYTGANTNLYRGPDLDSETLPGWSIGRSVAVILRGTYAHGDSRFETPESLVDSYSNRSGATLTLSAGDYRYSQRITTGPNPRGYRLSAVSFAGMEVTDSGTGQDVEVRIQVDQGTTVPGVVFTRFGALDFPGGGTQLLESTAPANTVLAPNATYWITLGPSEGTVRFQTVGQDNITNGNIRFADGWSFDGFARYFDGSDWVEAAGYLVFEITGVAIPDARGIEPGGGDFAAGPATAGVLRVGQTGVARLSDHGDIDWFRLEGLEEHHRYRVDVDFLGGEDEMGGSAHIHEEDGPRSDLWATNFNGHTVIDFKEGPFHPAFGHTQQTKYVEIESVNPFPWSSSGRPEYHNIVPVTSVTNGDEYPTLEISRFMATHTIGHQHYALVSAFFGHGVQIIDITHPDSPSNASAISTLLGTFDSIYAPTGVATYTIGGRHFGLVASSTAHAVQIFEFTDPENPLAIAQIKDGEDGFDDIAGPYGVTTHTIGNRHYALIGATSDDAVQIIDISDPENPTAVTSLKDERDGYTLLDSPYDIATHSIGDRHYALAVDRVGHGVQIFEFTNPAQPVPVSSIMQGSGGVDHFEGPIQISTITIANRHYALVTAIVSNALHVIDFTDPVEPSVISTTVHSDEVPGLDGAWGVFPLTIGVKHYVVVTSYTSKGVGMFDISDPHSPQPVALAIDDEDGYDTLDGASEIVIHIIDDRYYGLVASALDDGVQIFEIQTKTPTRNNWYTGLYTVTLTEIDGWQEFVHNREEIVDNPQEAVPDDWHRIGHLHNAGATGHVRELAIDFTTGDHTDGYTLDRIETNLTPEPIEYEATITSYEIHGDVHPDQTIDIIEPDEPVIVPVRQLPFARPELAIHADDSGNPGDELCILDRISGYDVGLWIPIGPVGDGYAYYRTASQDPNDRFFAGECAAVTLDPDTRYWIVFKSTERFPSLAYGVTRATNRNYYTSTDGWEIGNSARARTYTLQGNQGWQQRNYSIHLRISGFKN